MPGTRIQKLTNVLAALTLVVGASLIGSRPAAAQNRPAAAPGDMRSLIASVDSQRLLTEYKLRKTSSDEIDRIQTSMRQVLERLESNSAVFLTEAEIRELSGLLEKTQQTDADKVRVSALESKAREYSAELTRLQNTTSPSEQQRARLQELAGLRQKGIQAANALGQGFQARLTERRETLGQKVVEDVRAAIAKVAAARNLALVFSNEVALYAANDITADVLKELNR